MCGDRVPASQLTHRLYYKDQPLSDEVQLTAVLMTQRKMQVTKGCLSPVQAVPYFPDILQPQLSKLHPLAVNTL
jgi:hypothetical protein